MLSILLNEHIKVTGSAADKDSIAENPTWVILCMVRDRKEGNKRTPREAQSLVWK